MDARNRGNKQESSNSVKKILWLSDFPPNQVMIDELERIFNCKINIVVEDPCMPAVYVAALLDNNRCDEIVIVSNQAEILMPFIMLDIRPLCPEIVPVSISEEANVVMHFPCGKHHMRFTRFKIPFGANDEGIQYVNIDPSTRQL